MPGTRALPGAVAVDFTPDGRRARSIDRRMRAILGDSLNHLAEQAGHLIPDRVDRLRWLASRLEAGERLAPEIFGQFADACVPLAQGDITRGAMLLAELADSGAAGWRAPHAEILALDAPQLSGQRNRFERLMNFTGDWGIAAPDAEQIAGFEAQLEQALELMARAAPELLAEHEALVRQLILVSDSPESTYRFDGGSCYMLWGALFLNLARPRSPVSLVEVITHETSHLLLFGFASDEVLVHNEDSERYPSPLRDEPRPMDGIYHATFVSARMHWAMTALLDSGLLDAEARSDALRRLATDAENFAAGDSVVRRHGRLSTTGEAVMRGARDYMAAVGAIA